MPPGKMWASGCTVAMPWFGSANKAILKGRSLAAQQTPRQHNRQSIHQRPRTSTFICRERAKHSGTPWRAASRDVVLRRCRWDTWCGNSFFKGHRFLFSGTLAQRELKVLWRVQVDMAARHTHLRRNRKRFAASRAANKHFTHRNKKRCCSSFVATFRAFDHCAISCRFVFSLLSCVQQACQRRAVGADHVRPYGFISRFKILPVAVLGNESCISTERGYL